MYAAGRRCGVGGGTSPLDWSAGLSGVDRGALGVTGWKHVLLPFVLQFLSNRLVCYGMF